MPETIFARVLFFSEAVTLAHLVRPLALAEALAAAGCEVHFASAYRFETLFKDKPSLCYWPIESISYDAFISSVSGERSAYNDEQVASYIAEEEALIRDVIPDLIVSDARLSLSVTAPALGIPLVNLNNAYWSPHRADKQDPVPNYKRSALYRLLPPGLAELFFPFPVVKVLHRVMKPLYEKRFLAPFNRARRRRGLRPFGDFRTFYTFGNWTLYADTPELIPLKNPPAAHRFLGPVLWSPSSAAPLPAGDSDRPVLYVSFGSSNDVPDCRGIVDELARLEVDLWVATAGRFSVPASARVRVSDFLPGLEASRRAAVVVCSGGSTAAYQALAAGTPVVGIPSNNDQHLAMAAIERSGAGLSLRSDHVTPAAVRDAVKKILEEPRYRERAQRLSESFAAHDAPRRFVDFVREAVSTKTTPGARVPPAQTLTERLRRQAERSPDRPAHWGWPQRQNGEPPLSYGDLWGRVQSLAAALSDRGLQKGERVGFLSGVDPAWESLHMAVLLAGGAVVGLDINDAPDRLRAAARLADVRAWVVQDAKTLMEFRDLIPERGNRFVVLIRADEPAGPGQGAEAFVSLLNAYRGRTFAGAPPAPGDLATVIFTSGTTGEPKGIPYTHRQLVHAVRAIARAFHVLPVGFESLCWLPLSNLFQRIVNLCAVERAALLTFIPSPHQLMEAVPAVRPTLLIGVPRFFEKVEAGVQKSIAERPRWVRALFRAAQATGTIYQRSRSSGHKARFVLWPLFVILDWAVLRAVRERFGGRLRFLVSGAAPLGLKTMEFFEGLGLLVLEAYGTSENAIPLAMNRPWSFRFGTVGRPLGPNEVEIASDHEVMVKGPSLFAGYWAGATPPPRFEGAFYRTGDEGRWENGGFLRLIGRRSEFLKTSTGRRVTPGPIEQWFKELPFVDQAVVLGNGRKGPALLVTLDAQALGASGTQLSSDQEARAAEVLRAHAARLPPLARPLGILALNRAFSVVRGEITANLKLRRGIIEDHYRTALDDLYDRAVVDAPEGPPLFFLSAADVRARAVQSFTPLRRLRTWAPARWWGLGRFFLQAGAAYGRYAVRLLRRPWEYRELHKELFGVLFRSFRDAVGPLKGPLIKIAQTLSYLDMDLSPSARGLLTELQHRSPPLAADKIRAVVRRSLGQDPRDLFAEWSDAPLAAASVSQIHLARLKEGARVAVKVRYPGIDRIVKSDLRAVRAFLPLLARATGVRNVRENFEEAKKMLLAECDFRREAAFMDRFRSIFAEDPIISIPAVYHGYCSESVLTMDYVDGQTYAEFKATGTGADFDRAGQALVRFFDKAALQHGLFNADPHPGNYLFKNGRVYFLDFGFCKEWTPEFIGFWKAQTRAVLKNDLPAFAEATKAMGVTNTDGTFNYGELLAGYRATLEKMLIDRKPFRFTPAFVREEGRVIFNKQLGGGKAVNPPEILAFSRLFWGQHAVLADLGARIDYSAFNTFLE
ncbi:MAG: AMP-binding protein [Elusimicrobia bacterium]|nr:AMP-binding protein [Elusimicrobiota bacterium]